MAHLHAVIGDQTTKKLEDILQVTEENRTTLIARLIREEWERQREAYSSSAIYVGGSPEPIRVDRDRVFIAGADQSQDRLV